MTQLHMRKGGKSVILVTARIRFMKTDAKVVLMFQLRFPRTAELHVQYDLLPNTNLSDSLSWIFAWE